MTKANCVSIGLSTVNKAGRGVFAERDIEAGDTVFVEAAMVLVASILQKDNASVSKAWGLVELLCRDGVPTWFNRLTTNRRLCQFMLKQPEEEALLREMMRRFPTVNVVAVFGKTISNFFANETHAWLSPISCMLNHSSQANVGMHRPEPFNEKGEPYLQYIAGVPIVAGQELFIDYGEDHAIFFSE